MPPKNIYIVGASSTGKTTLVNALAEHFSSSDNDPRFLTQQRPSLSDSAEAHHAFRTQGCPPKIIHELARPILAQLRITRDDLGTNPEITLKAQRAILSARCAAERSVTTPAHTEHTYTDTKEGE
jgi:GTPase SAR1 family protein